MPNPNKYRRKGLSMDILNTITLKSNRQIKINFNGGDLSSDAGLPLIKEFAAKIGFAKLIKKKFKTNDTSVRFHKDDENLMQMIYQIISAYFEDDCADELTIDPVFNAILEKNSLASQPTLSRFFNRMDEDTLLQFDDIDKSFRDIIYSIKCPEHMLLDLDSTLFDTYGNQEGEGFSFHYQAHGYHPLLCCDGLTGDLLKAELRDGTLRCSNDADRFMEPLFQEYLDNAFLPVSASIEKCLVVVHISLFKNISIIVLRDCHCCSLPPRPWPFCLHCLRHLRQAA